MPCPTVPRGRRPFLALIVAVLGLVGAVGAGLGARPALAVPSPYPLGPGYWLFARDGGVFGFGAARFLGSTGGVRLNQPMVGGEALPFLEGYWEVAADGGIFAFGGARFFGSTGAIRLNRPVVDMAAHPSGLGYWLVATDGGVFSFGAARFFGSTGATRLNQNVVGMAATPSGNGYWLVAADGGVFAFGDARFFGSTGAIRLNRPIVGMAPTPTGRGYWLVAADGGVFPFGDARFLGSTGALALPAPIVGMAPTPSGNGYHLVAADGGVFAFGDAVFQGSTGGVKLNQPIQGMAARPGLAVKVDPFEADGPGRSQSWVEVGTDFQLALAWDGSGGVPAGAKVLGVEGLNVAQLGELRFVVETSPDCPGAPRFNVYADTDGDGTADTTGAYPCLPGAFVNSFNPASTLPPHALVVAVDVVLGAAGSVSLDQLGVAGVVVNDFRTFTASGPLSP